MQTRLIITFLFTLSCVTYTQEAASKPLTQPNIPQKTNDVCWQFANDISDIVSRTNGTTQREMELWDKLFQKNDEGEYMIADPKCKEIIISALKRRTIDTTRLACELAHLSTQTCEDTLQRYNMLSNFQKRKVINEMYFVYKRRVEQTFPTATEVLGFMIPFGTYIFSMYIAGQRISAGIDEIADIFALIIFSGYVGCKYVEKRLADFSEEFWKDKWTVKGLLNFFIKKVNREYLKLPASTSCSNALKSQN